MLHFARGRPRRAAAGPLPARPGPQATLHLVLQASARDAGVLPPRPAGGGGCGARLPHRLFRPLQSRRAPGFAAVFPAPAEQQERCTGLGMPCLREAQRLPPSCQPTNPSAARPAGVSCFDIDFTLTADGQLLATHPDDLASALAPALPGGAGRIPELSLAELRAAGADEERFPTAEALIKARLLHAALFAFCFPVCGAGQRTRAGPHSARKPGCALSCLPLAGVCPPAGAGRAAVEAQGAAAVRRVSSLPCHCHPAGGAAGLRLAWGRPGPPTAPAVQCACWPAG